MKTVPTPPRRLPTRQRGAALLTAMIIVTLIATLAVSMVWQQWRAVQVEGAERARTQSSWILSGALDWAKLILAEDQRNTQRTGQPTALTSPWAVPLAEARLSTFLAADKDNNTDDGPEAFLSGSITDMQGRYNLNRLFDDTSGVPNNDEVRRLDRLCTALNLDSSVSGRIVNGLRDARAGTANAPLEPVRVSQLTWLGVDAASVTVLEPYVAILPKVPGDRARLLVNINTAPREVLRAVLDDSGTTEWILQTRQRTPFTNTDKLKTQAPGLDLDKAKVGTTSNFFEVRGRLRLADRILEERSLIQRLPNFKSLVLERERVSSRESSGS
ncbi:MAG TPA: type II secretion system minor pseudopilin GspK [Burkholderiaceae bacterium]|nr:type II secretion system minor pseudopilin GspK [Burkholderiaceae bacterium]